MTLLLIGSWNRRDFSRQPQRSFNPDFRKCWKVCGSYFQASGALDGLAPTGTFLWNGEDPSQLTNFTIRFAKFNADLVDMVYVLGTLVPNSTIIFKDAVGRAFTLIFQSFSMTTDGNANDVYDCIVQGVASNSNYIYGPAEIETCGFDFILASAGGGGDVNTTEFTQAFNDPFVGDPFADAFVAANPSEGLFIESIASTNLFMFSISANAWFQINGAGGGIASVNDGQGITIDVTTPSAPIVDLGGVVDEEIVIDIQGTVAETESVTISGTADAGDTMEFVFLPEGTQLTVDDGTPNTVTNAGFYAGSVNINTQNLSGTSKTHVLNLGDNDRLFLSASDSVSGDVISFALYDDKVELTMPAVESGTALVGQVLTLQNATTGEVEFQAGAGGNTIYSGDDALTGTRTVQRGWLPIDVSKWCEQCEYQQRTDWT